MLVLFLFWWRGWLEFVFFELSARLGVELAEALHGFGVWDGNEIREGFHDTDLLKAEDLAALVKFLLNKERELEMFLVFAEDFVEFGERRCSGKNIDNKENHGGCRDGAAQIDWP